MATTTEPPWLNMASGTAPRNGTTSHTINFGWTSASGSLLAVFVYGAVTHAVTGWTEQEQPINSGELSLFTKTSTGDTSITVTHNGSNYPVQWIAYEYPAGTTFTGSDADFDTVEAFTTLSGLPGTAQVILAARGRVATTSETGASSTWTTPWVEDADLFIAPSPTDGCYMTVGHQINVTATSVTPAATTTYSGTWSAPDRQRIVAAFNVAVASTTITRTADDSTGLSDTAAAGIGYGRSATDSAGLTDSTARGLGLVVTDSVGTTDTTAVVSAFARVQSDSAGLADTPAAAAAFARTASDVAGLVDAVTPQLFTLITRTATDSMGLSDTDSPQALSIVETVTDSVGLTDTATAVLTTSGTAVTRTADDTAGLTDAVTAASAFARAQADNVGLTDAIAVVSVFARTTSDGFGLVDAVTVELAGAGTRQANDSIGLTDSLSIASAQTLADSLGLTDVVLPALTAARAATDSAGLTDAVTAVLTSTSVHVRIIDDSMGLTSAHLCRRRTHRPNRGTTPRYALVPD